MPKDGSNIITKRCGTGHVVTLFSVRGNPDAPVQQFPSHVPALICFVGTEYRLQCHLNLERLSSII